MLRLESREERCAGTCHSSGTTRDGYPGTRLGTGIRTGKARAGVRADLRSSPALPTAVRLQREAHLYSRKARGVANATI